MSEKDYKKNSTNSIPLKKNWPSKFVPKKTIYL
jgi:hypothetical protein